MTPSIEEDLTQEISKFGARLNAITDIYKAISTKTTTLPNITRFVQQLSNSSDDKELVELLNVYELGDVKQYLLAHKAVHSLFTPKTMGGVPGKYVMPLAYMQRWQDGANIVCNANGGGLKQYVTSSDVDTMRLLGDLANLKFPIDNLNAAISNPNTSFCSSSRMGRTWAAYLDTCGVNVQETLKETELIFKFFKLLSTVSPSQMLDNWNNPIMLDRTTFGDVVKMLFEQESDLRNTSLPDNIDAIRSAMSEDGVTKLLELARTSQVAGKVDNLIRSTIAANTSNNNKNDVDELEKTLSNLMTAVDNNVGSNVASTLKNMVDIQSKLTMVLRSLKKYLRSAGYSGKQAHHSIRSLWSGSGTGIIHPLPVSSFGESRPDPTRMLMYVKMLEQQLGRLKSDPLVTDIKNSRENANVIIAVLTKSAVDPTCDRPGVRASIFQALKIYTKNVMRLVVRYERKHSDFIMWSNRRALEYMVKWASVPNDLLDKSGEKIVGKDNEVLIESYFKMMSELGENAGTVMNTAEEEALRIFVGGDYQTILNENEDEVMFEKAQKLVTSLEEFLIGVRGKIVRMYSPSGYGLLDVLRHPTFIIMYLLKAVRVLLIWAALSFAKAVFLPLYNDAVYVRNKSPPHPLLFVAIFIGFELGLNVAMYFFLMTLQFLFKTKDNTFPINDHILKAALVDYILSTTLITLLAVIIAMVIRRKKYFRYRFEGDRGIRAMSDMLLSVSSGILIIPFFRFLDT